MPRPTCTLYLFQKMQVSDDSLCDFSAGRKSVAVIFRPILVPAAVDSSMRLVSWRDVHAFGKLAQLFE
jgi:hypothetical protein